MRRSREKARASCFACSISFCPHCFAGLGLCEGRVRTLGLALWRPFPFGDNRLTSVDGHTLTGFGSGMLALLASKLLVCLGEWKHAFSATRPRGW